MRYADVVPILAQRCVLDLCESQVDPVSALVDHGCGVLVGCSFYHIVVCTRLVRGLQVSKVPVLRSRTPPPPLRAPPQTLNRWWPSIGSACLVFRASSDVRVFNGHHSLPTRLSWWEQSQADEWRSQRLPDTPRQHPAGSMTQNRDRALVDSTARALITATAPAANQWSFASPACILRSPANARRPADAGSMPGRRRRRRPNIEPALVGRLVFAGRVLASRGSSAPPARPPSWDSRTLIWRAWMPGSRTSPAGHGVLTDLTLPVQTPPPPLRQTNSKRLLSISIYRHRGSYFLFLISIITIINDNTLWRSWEACRPKCVT